MAMRTTAKIARQRAKRPRTAEGITKRREPSALIVETDSSDGRDGFAVMVRAEEAQRWRWRPTRDGDDFLALAMV